MKEILNKSQHEAVTTTEGPLLIIAGPGSGKTKTLVERTIHLLIDKKIKPENILISTFTDKAATELITRISERLKENNLKLNLDKMYIGTLHSIFRRIIEENIEYSYFESDFKVLDDIEQAFFIYTHIQEFINLDGFKEFFNYIPTRNNWEKSKKILFWLNDLNEHAKNLSQVKTSDSSILFLKNAQLKYRHLLVENNIMDFSTIQQELYRMLMTNEELLDKISKELRYLMIDEYQDTNKIQEKLIFLLCNRYENICVVGDDDQAIYRFRGATVENILSFPTKFEKGRCRKITLDINYRSQLDILRICNHWISLIDWGKSRHRKNMVTPETKIISPTASAVRIGGEGEKNWCENIYRFIKTLKDSNKISDYNQVAFLFRSVQNPRVKQLKRYLIEMGIPVYSPRSKDFFEKDEIMLVIAALLIYFPHCKNLVFTPKKSTTTDIYTYYDNCIALLKKEIKKDTALYEYLVCERKKNIEREEFPNLREIFYKLLQFDTFKEYIKAGDSSIDELTKVPTYNLAKFTEILERYEQLTKIDKITKENIETYIRYFFKSYIRLLRENKLDEYENKEAFPKGALPFITFHQSKGLEFPVVVVGSLENDIYPPEQSIEELLRGKLQLREKNESPEKREMFDFWRLYYTAFSRAKDLLVLTSTEFNNYKRRAPSKVFTGLFYSLPEWNNSEKFELEHLNISEIKDSQNKKLLSYTSHIATYEFCPLKYQFLREFKFVELKDSNNFYGTFFHKVIEKIHNYTIKNGKLPNDEWINSCVDSIRRVLERLFIYQFEDSKIIQLYEDIERYIKNIVPESLIESELKLYSIEDNYILLGILDLVKRNEIGFEIVDFKTGKLNRNYVEKYKKQLAIYSYLLSLVDEKNISSYLYFPEELNPYVQAELTKEDIENEIKNIDKISSKILANEFNPREFDSGCKSCDFRWYCKSNIEKEEE